VPILHVIGIVAAVNHIGYNWTAYFRARAETRPIAVASVVSMLAFVAVGIPALLTIGVTGFAVGIAAQAAVSLLLRTRYLRRLFGSFRFLGHALRAFVPVLPAVALILAFRLLGPDERTLGLALLELGIYFAVTLAATIYFESRLLTEVVGYVRGRRPAPSEAVAEPGPVGA
jgi:hypothetical protein